MILITGDSGFIGRHLVVQLMRRGNSIRGIDLAPKPGTSPDYSQIVGNILDWDAVMSAMAGAQCIIHLAAEHKDFGITREKYFKVNEEGTKHLLRCASELNIKEFVFYSSVAVYGSQEDAGEDSVPQPTNPYGESKLAAERAIKMWAGGNPARKAVIIRPTVVFGPFSRANIFRLISYVCDKKFVWVGKGEHIKSIAYVENLVEATLFLLDHMKSGVEVFNYSDEPQMTTRQLVSLIAKTAGVAEPRMEIPLGIALPVAKVFDTVGSFTGKNFSITTARIRKFNTPTVYDARRIKRIGFKPSHSIAEGLDRNIKWYFEELKTGKSLQFEHSGE